jgi:hypothetical protein
MEKRRVPSNQGSRSNTHQLKRTPCLQVAPFPTNMNTIVQPQNPSLDSKPEWGRSNAVTKLFGIKKSTLVTLAKAGKVRTTLLSVTGSKLGIRLYDLSSIRELLNHPTSTPSQEGGQ